MSKFLFKRVKKYMRHNSYLCFLLADDKGNTFDVSFSPVYNCFISVGSDPYMYLEHQLLDLSVVWCFDSFNLKYLEKNKLIWY